MNYLASLFCVIGALQTLSVVATAGRKGGNASTSSFATNFHCSGHIKCYCSPKEATHPNHHRDTNPATGFVSPDGRPYEAPRIVGGIVSIPHSHPHQISFQRLLGTVIWSHFCGGSILKPDIILTAAHCIEDIDLDRVRVVAGAHSIFYNEPTQQISRVHSVKAHPNRIKKSFDYDYGIIRLISPLTFDTSVKSIKLATKEPISGNCTATGWGCTKRNCLDIQPHRLMEVNIPIVSRPTCAEAYESTVTERMICAGSTGKGNCLGDSGGPLVCGGKLAGIDSWGEFPCVQRGYPGVLANVAEERRWIEQQ